MRWRRQMNYHNSRPYGADETEGSKLRLDLAVWTGWARQQLEKMLRAGAPRSDDFGTLIHDPESSFFSLLGAANENARQSASSIWPSPADQAKKRRETIGAPRRKLDA